MPMQHLSVKFCFTKVENEHWIKKCLNICTINAQIFFFIPTKINSKIILLNWHLYSLYIDYYYRYLYRCLDLFRLLLWLYNSYFPTLSFALYQAVYLSVRFLRFDETCFCSWSRIYVKCLNVLSTWHIMFHVILMCHKF